MITTENTNTYRLAETPLTQLQESNGDFILTETRTKVYVSTDIANGTRQVNSAIQSVAALSSGSATVAGVTATIGSFGLLGAALVNVGASVCWTIPDSKRELQSVKDEFENASDEPSKAEAAEALSIAKLGVKNHYLLFTMGVTQIASASTAIASPTVANYLGYAPALTGAVSSMATIASGVALGAVYTARGLVMMKKAYKSNAQVNSFYEEFRQRVQADKSLNSAISFMQETEKNQTYLSRRVDLFCLRDQANPDTFDFVKNEQVTDRAKCIQYLERVDKAVYSAKLKNKIAFSIGFAMVIGGILAIAVSILSGGTAPLIVALISATIFVMMEYTFVTYDSSRAFVWLRDRYYKKPDWLD